MYFWCGDPCLLSAQLCQKRLLLVSVACGSIWGGLIPVFIVIISQMTCFEADFPFFVDVINYI